MIRKDGLTDLKSILDDMSRAANWRGKGAYGAPSIPDYERFKCSLMRLQDEIDRRNEALSSKISVLEQVPLRIESPELTDCNELHKLYYDMKTLIREGKPFEDNRDRIVQIMLRIISDYETALRKAKAIQS